MRNHSLFFLLAFIVFTTAVPQKKVFAQEITGSGIWLGIDLKKKIAKKFDLNFCPQFRTVTSPPQFGSSLLETGLDFEAAKNLTTSFFYRIDIKPATVQHRFYIDIAFDHKFAKKVTVGFRLRAQREFQISKLPDNYLRPKVSVKYKLNKKVSPYLSSELFYHIIYKRSEFDDWRFEAGFNWNLKHNMSLKTYYLLDKEFNVAPWGMQHIAGITFGKDW